MYTYNVTIKILPSIEEEWLQWMKNEHIQEVLSTQLFSDFSFYQLLEPTDHEEDGITYVVQYFTHEKKNYERYIEEYAPALRQKGFDRFGDRFIAFRTLLRKLA